MICQTNILDTMIKPITHFLLYVLLSFFCFSCTPILELNVLQPAEINIPSHIYKIGLVNRSTAGKSDRVLNVLEGILSGEDIGEDREGGDKALAGLKSALEQSERYSILIPPLPKADKAGGLTTEEVQAICKQYNLDALVVLEYFDSNSIVNVNEGKRKEKVKDQLVEVTFFRADGRLNVNTKWTLYDDSTGAIIDMHESEDYLTFSNEGPTPDAAKGGLPSKRYAINSVGQSAGDHYGTRIAPYWVMVEREYFRKGSDKLKQAARFSKDGIWIKAIEIWKEETTNSDPKIAGRANYNLAIACEREGNVELALVYAKKSRDQYGIAKAANYAKILEGRHKDQQRLDQQLQKIN